MKNMKEIFENLIESVTVHPIVGKAYGIDSWKELHDKIQQDLDKKLLKNIDGFFLDSTDSKMPIKLISVKDAGIIGIGLRGGKLSPLKSIAIFKLDDMKNKL